MVYFSPARFDVQLTFRALALRRSTGCDVYNTKGDIALMNNCRKKYLHDLNRVVSQTKVLHFSSASVCFFQPRILKKCS